MKFLWSVVTVLGACATSTNEDVGTTSQDVISVNGTSLNGTSLNGTSMNGTSLNGTSMNGTSLNGTSLNGTSLNGTSLNGTSLNGVSLNGTSLNGSTWTGTLTNGDSINMRIDDSYLGDGNTGFYAVSFEADDGWHPLCPGTEPDGSAVHAIAVPGSWDGTARYVSSTTQFTWSCRHKSIAKCIEMGYQPWNGREVQMASCIRMLRADYCGTGVSYTVDGTLLNLYDAAGVQQDTESWAVEAEWSPAGAVCVNPGHTRAERVSHTNPPCLAALASPTCGSFANGASIIDELSPQY